MAKTSKDNVAADNGAAAVPQEILQQAAAYEGSAAADAKTATDAARAAGSPPAPGGELEYSAADLASAARARFGVPPEVVRAALATAGLDKAAINEARRIVKEFLERKVK